MGSTLSTRARNHANAPQKVFQALTTSCFTNWRDFSHLHNYVERIKWQRLLTYPWKLRRCFPNRFWNFLQGLAVKMQSPTRTKTVSALCYSSLSHSRISDKLAAKLNVQGTASKLTIHGVNYKEVVNIRMVQLKLILVFSGDTKC